MSLILFVISAKNKWDFCKTFFLYDNNLWILSSFGFQYSLNFCDCFAFVTRFSKILCLSLCVPFLSLSNDFTLYYSSLSLRFDHIQRWRKEFSISTTFKNLFQKLSEFFFFCYLIWTLALYRLRFPFIISTVECVLKIFLIWNSINFQLKNIFEFQINFPYIS